MSSQDSSFYQKMGAGLKKATLQEEFSPEAQDSQELTSRTGTEIETSNTTTATATSNSNTKIPQKSIAQRRREALLNAKNRQNLIYGLPPKNESNSDSTSSSTEALNGSSSNNLDKTIEGQEEEEQDGESGDENDDNVEENDEEIDGSMNSMRSVPSSASMNSITSNNSSVQSQQNPTTTDGNDKNKEEDDALAAKQKEKWARRRKQKRTVNMDVIIASKEAVIAENKGKKDTDETKTKEPTQEKIQTKIDSIPKLTGNARRNKYLNAKKEKERTDNTASDSSQKKTGLGTKAMSETSKDSDSVFDAFERRLKMKKSYFTIIIQYLFFQPWFLSSFKRLILALFGIVFALYIGHTEDYVYADHCIDPLSYIMKESPVEALYNIKEDTNSVPTTITDSQDLLQNKLEDFFKAQDSVLQNSYEKYMGDYLGIQNKPSYEIFTGGPINCIPFIFFVLSIYFVFALLERILYLIMPRKMMSLKFEEERHRPSGKGGYIESGLKMIGAASILNLYTMLGAMYQELLYFFFFFLTTLGLFPYLNVYKPLIISYLSTGERNDDEL